METNHTTPTLSSSEFRMSRIAFDTLRIAAAALDSADADSMLSSAELCINDAFGLVDAGDYRNGMARALDSLKYSAGVYSEEYRTAVKNIRAALPA